MFFTKLNILSALVAVTFVQAAPAVTQTGKGLAARQATTGTGTTAMQPVTYHTSSGQTYTQYVQDAACTDVFFAANDVISSVQHPFGGIQCTVYANHGCTGASQSIASSGDTTIDSKVFLNGNGVTTLRCSGHSSQEKVTAVTYPVSYCSGTNCPSAQIVADGKCSPFNQIPDSSTVTKFTAPAGVVCLLYAYNFCQTSPSPSPSDPAPLVVLPGGTSSGIVKPYWSFQCTQSQS